MRRRTAWCLGFGGALAFYWGVATADGFAWKRHYHLWRDAMRAEAVVTAVEPDNHNSVQYEFQAAGRRFRSSAQGVSGVAVGDRLTVSYLAGEPEFSLFRTPGQDLAFMIIGPMILSVLAGFVVMARVGKRV